MKNLFKEFKNSIYGPRFYNEIGNKSLKSIFLYIFKIDLIVSAIGFIYAAMGTFTSIGQSSNLSGSAFVIAYVLGIFSVFITLFLTVLVIWLIYGFVLGLLILAVSTIIKKKIPYTNSIKIALHAMTAGVVLTIIPIVPSSSWLGIIVPILVVLINLRGKK